MNSSVNKTTSAKDKKSSLTKTRLPWILLGVVSLATVLLIIDRIRLHKLNSLGRICDDSLVSKFVDARRSFAREEVGSREIYDKVVQDIVQKDDYENDPTCVYMNTKYLYDMSKYDEAYYEYERLGQLYKDGKIADSRYMTVDSIQQIREDIVYFKALEIEASQDYPDEADE